MLGRLILILLQAAIAWFLSPILAGYIPVPGAFSLFVLAILFAIIVFLVGVIGAQVLRGVGQPGTSALSWSLVLALICAAIATFAPDFVPQLTLGTLQARGLVLAGAILGYLIRR